MKGITVTSTWNGRVQQYYPVSCEEWKRLIDTAIIYHQATSDCGGCECYIVEEYNPYKLRHIAVPIVWPGDSKDDTLTVVNFSQED